MRSWYGAAVYQVAEQVVYQSEGQWLDPQQLLSMCWSVLGQDSEPEAALDAFVVVWVSVNVLKYR